MSFNMNALRASIGSIPLRQPVRAAQRPTALSMPSYTGLSLSGRLSVDTERESRSVLSHSNAYLEAQILPWTRLSP